MSHPAECVPRGGVALLLLAALLVAGCRGDAGSARFGQIEVLPDREIPADAAAFEGHRYKVYDVDLPWHEAKARCEAMGGHLACVETQAEQDFIAKLADGRYLYLGATDEAEEGAFVWINGAPWDYTAWYDDQPNNWDGEEHYLATYDDGLWVDVASQGDGFWMPIGFICEWPAAK